MQPTYHKSPYKQAAREENAKIYRRLTGNHSIPRGMGYWTLSDLQPPEEGSEITQMVTMGLLEKCQFHGVDLDHGKRDQNEAWHPEAKWYAGEWCDVIANEDEFSKASLIYLDSTSILGHDVACEMTVKTMRLATAGSVLLVNVMANNPRSSQCFDSDVFIKRIISKMPPEEISVWRPDRNFNYCISKTLMRTFAFYKEQMDVLQSAMP